MLFTSDAVLTYVGDRIARDDEDTVNELRARAKDALLTMEIAREESVEETSLDLRDLEGMTPDLLAKLAQVFLDEEQVARLEAATSADEVEQILSSVQA